MCRKLGRWLVRQMTHDQLHDFILILVAPELRLSLSPGARGALVGVDRPLARVPRPVGHDCAAGYLIGFCGVR